MSSNVLTPIWNPQSAYELAGALATASQAFFHVGYRSRKYSQHAMSLGNLFRAGSNHGCNLHYEKGIHPFPLVASSLKTGLHPHGYDVQLVNQSVCFAKAPSVPDSEQVVLWKQLNAPLGFAGVIDWNRFTPDDFDTILTQMIGQYTKLSVSIDPLRPGFDDVPGRLTCLVRAASALNASVQKKMDARRQSKFILGQLDACFGGVFETGLLQ